MMSGKLEVLIIEDHPLYLVGLSQIMADLFKDVIIYKAATGKIAIEMISQHSMIDWILLDLQLPDMNGLNLLEEFKSMLVSAPVLVISSVTDMGILDKSLALGASGFLPKSANIGDIRGALSSIEENGHYLPEEQARRLQEYRSNVRQRSAFVRSHITRRQEETLILITQGYSNLEIGNALAISESTVKGHVSALLTLLDVDNRTHCVAETRRLDLFDHVL